MAFNKATCSVNERGIVGKTQSPTAAVVKFMWQHDRMKLVEKIDQKNPENLIKIIPTLRSISHDSYYWDNLC